MPPRSLSSSSRFPDRGLNAGSKLPLFHCLFSFLTTHLPNARCEQVRDKIMSRRQHIRRTLRSHNDRTGLLAQFSKNNIINRIQNSSLLFRTSFHRVRITKKSPRKERIIPPILRSRYAQNGDKHLLKLYEYTISCAFTPDRSSPFLANAITLVQARSRF